MKIMVVGGGGREHAIIKKLKENKEVTEIFALPGNGGMAKDATLVPIGAKDLDAIVDFAKENKYPLTSFVKPNCGHHPHSLKNNLDFIINFCDGLNCKS